MYGQTRNLFNSESRGLPNFLLKEANNFNSMWGREYVVYFCNTPNEDEIDTMIEGLIMLRVLENRRSAIP